MGITGFDVRGRRVTVAGAARSGVAAAELLVSRGAQVRMSDNRSDVDQADQLRSMGIELETGGHREETFTGADLIVLSPGVSPEQPAVVAARARGVSVIGEVELASRWLLGRIVAITGTKGKSTTTVLTGRMLGQAGFDVTVSGNIGEPLSNQVARSTTESIHVVEVSSFQLEQIDTFHPWVAVMLNFSSDHLDRHGSVQTYADAKARIFANQTERDWAVVNADDPAVLEMARRGRATRRLFGHRSVHPNGTWLEGQWITERVSGTPRRLVPLAAVHVLGPHLVDDVMAAATVASIAGVAPDVMAAVVDAFEGLEHAMETVRVVDGVRFVNDSKATNVEAAIRAVETFETGVVPIIGGRFKGGDLTLLRPSVARRARAVVAIGEASGLVHRALAEAVPVHDASSLGQAVELAFELARPDGVVLLSPACASFDMFRDYAERGRRFKEEVVRLASERGGMNG